MSHGVEFYPLGGGLIHGQDGRTTHPHQDWARVFCSHHIVKLSLEA
jgi:hypothetical protein